MNKQSLFIILFTVLMSMTGTKVYAFSPDYMYDIELKNADDVTIFYKWINNRTELAVYYEYYYEGIHSSYSGNVVIPESVEYKGKIYNVTSIGNHAFYNCSSLTSVTIPNSVTSINWNAFSGCSSLTSITIPHNVTSIGDNAFFGCSGLTSIKVESGNQNYDSRNNCNAIIDNNNQLIVGCKNTIIPNSVTSIGNSAFYNCIGLTSINIPQNVTSIDISAFSGCSGLVYVTLPSKLTFIGSSAFYGCNSLTDVYCK